MLGNDSDQPTQPYRPADEIAWIVSWLETELTTVELAPGGPPLDQGGRSPLEVLVVSDA